MCILLVLRGFWDIFKALQFVEWLIPHIQDTPVQLIAFFDSNWAADLNTRKSATCYVVYLGNNFYIMTTKKQVSVSRSSTEADYKAFAYTAADVAWIRLLLKDLGVFVYSSHHLLW